MPEPRCGAGPSERLGNIMFARLARAVFGTANDRVLKQFSARLPAIAGFEPKLAAMPDEELQSPSRTV